MKRIFERRNRRTLLTRVLLAFVLLVVACLTGGAYIYEEQRHEHSVRAINDRLDAIDSLRLPVRNADRLMFAYLVTGNEGFFEDFRTSFSAIRPALDHFRQSFPDPADILAVRDITENFAARFDIWTRFLNEKDSPAFRDMVRSVSPLVVTVARDQLNRLVSGQKILLAKAEQAFHTTRLIAFVALVSICLVIFLVFLSTILLILRSNEERERALAELEGTKSDLENIVTERTAKLRQAIEETKRSSRVLYDTINSMADAVVVADSTGEIIIANAKANEMIAPLDVFATKAWDEVYQLTEADGVTPVPIFDRPLVRALSGEQIDNYPLILRKRSETKSTSLQVTTRTIRDTNGSAEGIIAVYRDVTAIQETERQLRYAQKMEAIGQLTGGIAHDFNNILTVILGTIGMLRDGVAGDPELAEIAAMIDEAAGRGADLTQELLAFARKQPLQPKAIDVPALIQSAVKLLKPTLGEQVDIQMSIKEEVAPALADPSQLTTAILNLAVNARDAMPKGGKLTIEAANAVFDDDQLQRSPELKLGRYVAIAVIDSGEGMPPAVRDRIFEPFFTTKDVGRGTGLGLAMVYGFVKQSNGHVQVYSEVGQGTSIKLFLPAADSSALSIPDDVDDMTSPAGTESILVVEDDRLVGDYVSRQLTELGYTITLAETANDALRLIKKGLLVDLMLTDIILPEGMNGRELAREVVRLKPDMKIVFTSGYSKDAIIHHGRLDADVILLAKPYRKAKLAQTLRSALDAKVNAFA